MLRAEDEERCWVRGVTGDRCGAPLAYASQVCEAHTTPEHCVPWELAYYQWAPAHRCTGLRKGKRCPNPATEQLMGAPFPCPDLCWGHAGGIRDPLIRAWMASFSYSPREHDPRRWPRFIWGIDHRCAAGRNKKRCPDPADFRLMAAPFPWPDRCQKHGADRLLRILATYRRHGPAVPAYFRWPAPEGELGPELVIAWHDGRCAMCGERKRLYVDHCHASGMVRGLLCGSCNTAEGTTRDPYSLMAAYRARPPAVVIGWTEPYAKPHPVIAAHLGPAPDDPAAAVNYLLKTVELNMITGRGYRAKALKRRKLQLGLQFQVDTEPFRKTT